MSDIESIRGLVQRVMAGVEKVETPEQKIVVDAIKENISEVSEAENKIASFEAATSKLRQQVIQRNGAIHALGSILGKLLAPTAAPVDTEALKPGS